MIQDAELQALGLDDEASPAQIREAIARKQVQLEQALEKAPTDALRNKFRQQQEKLALLAAQLVPEAKSHTTPHTTSQTAPQTTPTPTGTAGAASLSQTKLADLPQSATQFDSGNTAQVNLREGQMLAGRYEVQEQIGAGGMGAVYRALDKTTGKEIALKVLLPALLKNERARERFLDEARISQQLSHPNIVNVYDVQQDGDFFFLTMELLEGQDLRQVMENRKLARQPFSEQEMRTIASQVGDALAYAHKYTVHRDLKPENVWLTEDGDYKLMDFGIARMQSTSQRTQTGAAMGTAYYMAPEQLKGQKNIDGRADQYALGVMLYELATGEVPAGLIKPLRESRRDLSRGFATTVMRTLNGSPEDRFADIAAFRQALEPRGGLELNLPWKNIGIAAGVLVALLGIGGIVASGSLDGLKGLLPMSKEEIAAQKASLAKIQGEIKVLKQRLDSSRRSLDSDVRDAQRNNSSDWISLSNWQKLTEDGIFAGSRLTELEGDLSMAEVLLRDEAFKQARPVFERVRAGYLQLQKDFTAAESLYAAGAQAEQAEQAWLRLKLRSETDSVLVATAKETQTQALQLQRGGEYSEALTSWQGAAEAWRQAKAQGDKLRQYSNDAAEEKSTWEKLKKNYGLSDPEPARLALEAEKLGHQHRREGDYPASIVSWQQSAEQWRAAIAAVAGDVARIDSERQAQAAAAAKRKREQERARLAENLKRLLAGNAMVSIPGGSFLMGSNSGKSAETPVHRVALKPFKMSQYEVTFAQYDAFAAATGRAKPDDSGWGRGKRPVIGVSWEDATAYARWLSKQTGQQFRLPSEAEWEYAARAGSDNKYSWGSSISCGNARWSHHADGECGKDRGTVPVGSFAANAFGLYDMHGNVWEWTQDCWNATYNGAPSHGEARTDGDCSQHAVRGGSWLNGMEYLRSASRVRYSSADDDRDLGFRLAQDL
ncbi:serine/threonine-protein kinase PknD [Microbulbifer aestuariivivens]|uniref:Serine/threonine-protein kinase PknD n=1 Tax=Microbulbifer aestuariivivens TaxID=1908308 RepID=A0ABP9WQD4_9GAMM